nr:MAG: hypothetical protein DMG87_09145 [Acidobacteriota bacterium]
MFCLQAVSRCVKNNNSIALTSCRAASKTDFKTAHSHLPVHQRKTRGNLRVEIEEVVHQVQ